jgi:hypothetical protein
MGFFDALFGRTKVSAGKVDQLFQVSTAELDIESKLNSRFGGRAALVLRSVDNAGYEAIEKDLHDVLQIGGRDLPVAAKSETDAMGFHWMIYTGTDIEDVINALHLTADLIQESGYSDTLMAAMLAYDREDAAGKRSAKWYLIYSYRRASFYPFVPKPGKNRDSALEFRLASTLKASLNMEADQDRWYALWDPPF